MLDDARVDVKIVVANNVSSPNTPNHLHVVRFRVQSHRIATFVFLNTSLGEIPILLFTRTKSESVGYCTILAVARRIIVDDIDCHLTLAHSHLLSIILFHTALLYL